MSAVSPIFDYSCLVPHTTVLTVQEHVLPNTVPATELSLHKIQAMTSAKVSVKTAKLVSQRILRVLIH